MKEHKDGYCQECLQYKEEKDFTRHYLLIPVPKRKRCDQCHEVHENPFNAAIRASISESRSKKSRNPKTDPEFTKKRRDAEYNAELLAINKEFEL